MATDAATTQPWHVPEPSPWPIVGTAAALSSALGLIWFMHAGVPWLIYVGGILLINGLRFHIIQILCEN